MAGRASTRVRIALTSAVLLTGCYEGIDTDDLFADDGLGEFEDDDTSGDEAQDSSAGDGDGDGDEGDGDPSTTGDGDGDPDPSTTGDGDGDPGVPDNAYCDPVANWNPEWTAWELEVLELVNQARAQGGNCGSEGNFGPSGPLTIDPALTCAARVHSKDMADHNYFNHTNQQGQGPGWRIDQAGYSGGGWGENIAAGYSTPQQTVAGWLDSDGHCANMLNSAFVHIGIGYAYGPNSDYGHYWTQAFGGG